MQELIPLIWEVADAFIAPCCRLLIAFSAGFPLAFLSAFCIALVYIPSAVSTTLRYRSGVFGSLRDRRFLQNRFAMDSANLLFGAAFWTCATSAGAFYALVGGFVFLCLWDVSSSLCEVALWTPEFPSLLSCSICKGITRWNDSDTCQCRWNAGHSDDKAIDYALY